MYIYIYLKEYIHIYIHIFRPTDLEGKVFVSGPEDRGSIPDRVKKRTQEMVLDASLLYTQCYTV